jgi:predicted HNH restriction endonuclease
LSKVQIEEVRDKFRIRKGSIHNMRVSTVRLVATHRGIAEQTVIDKFSRQLRPDITSAAQFDKLLEEWLNQDSRDLQNILLKHKFYYDDVVLINNTFDKVDEEVPLLVEEDKTLADEFGFASKDSEFIEGKEKLRIHLVKERNPSLVRLAKEKWAAVSSGSIKCSICSFSFFETYGEIGKGFIDSTLAFLTVPVSLAEHFRCELGTGHSFSTTLPISELQITYRSSRNLKEG